MQQSPPTVSFSPSAPAGGVVCFGEPFILGVPAATGGYMFEWTRPNGSTSTGSQINIATASTEDAGNYTVRVMPPGGCFTEMSTPFNVKIEKAPLRIISNQGCATTSASPAITLDIGNSGAFNYSWKRDRSPISETSTTIQASMAGSYTVEVSTRAGMCVTESEPFIVPEFTTSQFDLEPMTCVNSPIQLTSNTVSDNAFTSTEMWEVLNGITPISPSDTSLVSPGDILIFSFNQVGTYTIRLTSEYRNFEICPDILEKEIIIANAPVFAGGATATVTYAENATTVVTTVVATDEDVGQTVTLALSGGADAGLFSITPASVLTFNTAPDYEMPTDAGMDNIYAVRITATDNGTPEKTAMQALTITVTDVNDNAPVFTSGATATVAYAENATTAVTTVVATDADAGQTITFVLSGGADAGLFSITPAGVLTFKVAPDYEVPTDTGTDNMYEVTITATDNGTPAMTAMQALTITVTDVNDNAPVFAEGPTATVAYAENTTTEVTTVGATDADTGQTVTFTLSGGADAGLFSITPASVLTFNTAPDYEMPTDAGMDNIYAVRITATDNGTPEKTAMQALTITVTDVNDNAPVFTSGATATVAYAEKCHYGSNYGRCHRCRCGTDDYFRSVGRSGCGSVFHHSRRCIDVQSGTRL